MSLGSYYAINANTSWTYGTRNYTCMYNLWGKGIGSESYTYAPYNLGFVMVEGSLPYVLDSGSYSTGGSTSSPQAAYSVIMKYDITDTDISFYCESVCNVSSSISLVTPKDFRTAEAQLNSSGIYYQYIIFG